MDIFKLLGKIVIEGVEGAKKDLEGVSGKAEASESKITGAFKKIGAAVITYFATDKIIDFGKACVEATATISAEQSAFEQIMGDYSNTATQKVSEIADATGMVDSRLTPYMTSMTAKFKGLGYDIDDATSYAQDGLMLAADAAAFWDKSLDESMSHLNSFVNGSYEGGEAIGLFANDTQMAAYAVKQGLIEDTKYWASLEEKIKQATRLEYAQNMMKQSGAVGQAAKESGQYANVMANLSEKWRQFKGQVGEPLLQAVVPIVEQLMISLENVTPTIEKLVTEFAPKIVSVIENILPTIAEIVEKLLPSFMEVVEKILPVLIEIFEEVAPIITEVLEIAVELIGSLCDSLLPPLTHLLEAVCDILEPLLEILEPIIKFLGELTGTLLGGLIDGIAELLGYDIGDKTAEEFAKMTKAEQEVIDKTKELSEINGNLHKSLESGFESIDGTYLKYDKLIEKLDGMVDSTGRVKEGHEAHVSYIVGELNSAFGTEIEIIDGVIQKYQEEKTAIEELMVTKKAQAYLNSGEGEYETAVQKQGEYELAYASAVNNVAEKEKEIDKAQEEYDALMEKHIQQYKSDYKTRWGTEPTGIDERLMYSNIKSQDDMQEAQGKIDGLNDSLETLKATKKDTAIKLSDNTAIIENWDNLSDKIAEGNIPEMQEAMTNLKNTFIEAEGATVEALENQAEKFAETYTEMEEAAKIEGSGVTKAMVDEARIMYIKSLEEWSKLSGMSKTELEEMLRMASSYKGKFSPIGVSYASEIMDGFAAAAAEQAYKITNAINNITNGLSSITADVKINSPSDLVYHASKSYSIPHYATGGIVTREHIAKVGENGAEAIIPLERNTEWIDRVASRINGSSSNSEISAKLDEMISLLKNQKIYLNGKALVGGIAGDIDKKLGSMARQKRRAEA